MERGFGGNQAAEFLAWLESAFPAITMMAEPLTEEQARDILAKFSAEDINRIIAQIDNKGAYKNKSAYSTFASFVAHDSSSRAVKPRRAANTRTTRCATRFIVAAPPATTSKCSKCPTARSTGSVKST